MGNPIARICVDRKLSYYRRPFQAQNLNLIATPPEQAAAGSDKLWASGTTLRIEFRGGTRAARQVVLDAAAQWSLYANITIVPVDSGDAEIRCSFDPGGSWSYIGTEILAVAANEPTMNIGWGPDIPTCLHELGHTLGLIHEHQNPLAGIPWNTSAVLAYYAGAPNYWPTSETVANVLTRYAGPLTNGGYDRNSIMEYPIDASLLTDPSYAVGWNEVLSDKDKAFIAQIYPGRQKTSTTVSVPLLEPPVVPATPTAVVTAGSIVSAGPVLKGPNVELAIPGLVASIRDEVIDVLGLVDKKINFTAVEQTVVGAYLSGGVDAVLPALITNASSFAEDPADAAIFALAFKLLSGLQGFSKPKT